MTTEIDRCWNATVTTVTAAATSAELLAANRERKGVYVHNDGGTLARVLFGTGTASATNFTVAIANGETWHMPRPVFVGAMQVIWDGAPSGNAIVTELFS